MGPTSKSALGLCLGAVQVEARAADTPSAAAAPDRGPAAKEVVVTGSRPLQGDKLPVRLLDTPQSVTVVPEALLQAQGATRLEDALKNVPGITLNAGEGAARGDTVNLRGFSAFNDFFLDGVRDAAVYTRDSFDLQTVEVLKGPSATLFGRGSTGGVINQVTKAATLTPLAVMTAETGTNAETRAALDVDSAVGGGTAGRLNAMAESSHVAGRDVVRNRRWGVAPAAALGLGGTTTLTLSYLHQEEDDVPDTGVPFIGGRPAHGPRDAFYGLSGDRTTSQIDVGTARLRHELTAWLSVADTLRYGSYAYDFVFAAPHFGDAPPTATTPLASVLVGRDAPSSRGRITNLTNQLDLTARFQTGFARHHLVVGVEVSKETSGVGRLSNPYNANPAWVPQTPLLDPDPSPPHPDEPLSSQQDTRAMAGAVYATDTIALGSHLDLIAGLRVDRFAASYEQFAAATGARLHLDHVDRLASPRLALVFKPTGRQSFYLSYGTSFDPSAEALSLTTKTADLGPVKAKTLEAGSKTSLLGGGLTLTAAVFQTEVDNAQTNDPDNPTLTVLNGDEQVRGVELGAVGRLSAHWKVTAGYTYLDGETLRSGTLANVGRFIPNAARNALNIWTEYRFNPAFELGLGVNALGSRFADPANTASVPGYAVWSAMGAYRLTPHMTLQLNATNLFDRLTYDGVYYTSASENHATPGPGRTVKLSVRASF